MINGLIVEAGGQINLKVPAGTMGRQPFRKRLGMAYRVIRGQPVREQPTVHVTGCYFHGDAGLNIKEAEQE